MKRMTGRTGIVGVLTLLLVLTACGRSAEGISSEAFAYLETTEAEATSEITAAAQPEMEHRSEPEHETTSQESGTMKMNIQIGSSTFTATLEDNSAVDALVQMMRRAPVVVEMSDYSGFEKVGDIGSSLPASNSQTTTESGDIVLYNGTQIVIFYGSNSWSYTRLGKIDDLSGWSEALGNGDVTVTFSTFKSGGLEQLSHAVME